MPRSSEQNKNADISELVRSSDVKWIDLQFTDLAGCLRHMTVSAKVFGEGFGKLDGSSVRGFTGIEESDLVLNPVPETFALIPWKKSSARFICRVYREEERFGRDPRLVAEKVDDYFHSLGLRLLLSAELEFFVFEGVEVLLHPWSQRYTVKSSEAYWNGSPYFNRAKDGYYAAYPRDKFEEFKLELGEILEKYFAVEVEVLHHEVAGASQHEINFRGGPATYAADTVQTVKYVAKALAGLRGLTVTFMPKPVYGDNGSGMHVHVSVWRGDENIFYDEGDGYAGLSQFARYFIGGLLEHGRALSAIVSPTSNSYKRLVPGYEAPVYLVWGRANRSAAVRVPNYRKNKTSARIEYRPPDPSANPYLAFAAIVLAGLDGVNKKIDPGNPVEENVYRMDPAKRRQLGIKELPRSLEEALDELESDHEWLKPFFSEDVIEAYIEMKRAEASLVNSYPTPAEFFYYHDV